MEISLVFWFIIKFIVIVHYLAFSPVLIKLEIFLYIFLRTYILLILKITVIKQSISHIFIIYCSQVFIFFIFFNLFKSVHSFKSIFQSLFFYYKKKFWLLFTQYVKIIYILDDYIYWRYYDFNNLYFEMFALCRYKIWQLLFVFIKLFLHNYINKIHILYWCILLSEDISNNFN